MVQIQVYKCVRLKILHSTLNISFYDKLQINVWKVSTLSSLRTARAYRHSPNLERPGTCIFACNSEYFRSFQFITIRNLYYHITEACLVVKTSPC